MFLIYSSQAQIVGQNSGNTCIPVWFFFFSFIINTRKNDSQIFYDNMKAEFSGNPMTKDIRGFWLTGIFMVFWSVDRSSFSSWLLGHQANSFFYKYSLQYFSSPHICYQKYFNGFWFFWKIGKNILTRFLRGNLISILLYLIFILHQVAGKKMLWKLILKKPVLGIQWPFIEDFFMKFLFLCWFLLTRATFYKVQVFTLQISRDSIISNFHFFEFRSGSPTLDRDFLPSRTINVTKHHNYKFPVAHPRYKFPFILMLECQ